MIWLAIILLVAFITLILIFVRIWRLQDQTRRVTVYRGTNDDQFAKKLFLDLIDTAEKNMELFDDGNSVPGSIYEDKDVVGAILKKLESSPDFSMRCFFNEDDNTEFKRRLSSVPTVDICCPSRTKRPLIEEHYKIVDDGVLVYISKHLLNGEERDYEFYNCRKVDKKYLEQVVNLRFGKMLETTRQKFALP